MYHRSNDERYTQIGPRDLRRYNAAVLRETKANNNSFERSILFQGAKEWNVQDVATRSVGTVEEFKRNQKMKLNALLPYGNGN